MTDLLTIVFTGLVIIQPSGVVSAMKADHHQLTVRIGDKTFEVKESLAFEGGGGGTQRLTGEMPPDLNRIFSTTSRNLSLNEEMTISFRLPGGKISRGGTSQTCTVNGDPVVFSAGVVWEGHFSSTASLVIDGRRHSLAGIDALGISNDYQGKGSINHLPMYRAVLNGADLKYNEPVCVVAVTKPGP